MARDSNGADERGFEGLGPRESLAHVLRHWNRRTVEISLGWPPHNRDHLEVRGTATDWRRGEGEARTATASVQATFGRSDRLVALVSEPDLRGLERLLDVSVRRGFRAKADAVVAAEGDAGAKLVGSLLDELPVAQLLSGYRAVAARPRVGGDVPLARESAVESLIDVCAGWQRGSEALRVIAQGNAPIAQSPPRVPPEPDDHETPNAPLGPDGLRRRRMIGVSASVDELQIDAWFRDSYRPPVGPEVVLHEYDLVAVVVAGVVKTCAATPRVLPFGECPSAAKNVGRLIGTPLAEIGAGVRAELQGVAGCTHLNDLLRSLMGVEVMLGR